MLHDARGRELPLAPIGAHLFFPNRAFPLSDRVRKSETIAVHEHLGEASVTNAVNEMYEMLIMNDTSGSMKNVMKNGTKSRTRRKSGKAPPCVTVAIHYSGYMRTQHDPLLEHRFLVGVHMSAALTEMTCHI